VGEYVLGRTTSRATYKDTYWTCGRAHFHAFHNASHEATNSIASTVANNPTTHRANDACTGCHVDFFECQSLHIIFSKIMKSISA
jgi:hypothetical protein